MTTGRRLGINVDPFGGRRQVFFNWGRSLRLPTDAAIRGVNQELDVQARWAARLMAPVTWWSILTVLSHLVLMQGTCLLEQHRRASERARSLLLRQFLN